jgi:hypothetical protein
MARFASRCAIGISAISMCLAAIPGEAQNQTAAPSAESVIDQIVSIDSRGWMFNSYAPGSASNAKVTLHDRSGANYSIVATYRYSTGNTGWVEARFSNGVISCVRYHNFPATCRPVGDYSYQLGAIVVVGSALAIAGAASNGGSSAYGTTRPQHDNNYVEADAWRQHCRYNGC